MLRKQLFRIVGLVLVTIFIALCGLRNAGTTPTLRRITNTSEETLNLNPSLSGDGRFIAFESNVDLAGSGERGFHALRTDVSTDPPGFVQLALSRAVAPAISQDGSRIAFASKDDPLGTNIDGNSEIFYYDNSKLKQITKRLLTMLQASLKLKLSDVTLR